MSDNILRLISVDPRFAPSPESAEVTRRQLAELVPDADEVTAVLTDDVMFIDAGINFERVRCPRCGLELDEDWWTEQMDTASTAKFSSLEVTTPCCAARVSLKRPRL